MKRNINLTGSPPGRFFPVWRFGVVYLLVAFLSFFARAEDQSTGAIFSIKTHSIKKGTGITPLKIKDWKQRLYGLNTAWFYTWRPLPPDGVSGRIEFVPMLWGANALNDETLNALKKSASEGLYRNLLVFNEPDAKAHANLSTEEAAKLWPNVVGLGLRLGSPATVNATNLWMQNFMSGIGNNGERLDFIAVHWYGGANPDNFLKHLEYVHQLYGRPIWITEFAVADWGAKDRGYGLFSPEQVLDFMKKVIPVLEKLDYIEKYAWFSPADPNNPSLWQSSLFDSEGNLTSLGKVYAEY